MLFFRDCKQTDQIEVADADTWRARYQENQMDDELLDLDIDGNEDVRLPLALAVLVVFISPRNTPRTQPRSSTKSKRGEHLSTRTKTSEGSLAETQKAATQNDDAV